MAGPFPRKKWDKQVWAKLKSMTKVDYISALQKDPRWNQLPNDGSRYVFENKDLPEPYNHVTIHYHPKEVYRNDTLLKDLLDNICWTEDVLLELKIIKLKGKKKKKK